jgi:hypothetical protein
MSPSISSLTYVPANFFPDICPRQFRHTTEGTGAAQGIKQDAVVTSPVSTVDLAATFLDFAWFSVFRQKFALEDDIGTHTCWFEASERAALHRASRIATFLPFTTVNNATTLKAGILDKVPEGMATSSLKPVLTGVRCAFLDRTLHSRMPLDPTHVCLKLEHACDQ